MPMSMFNSKNALGDFSSMMGGGGDQQHQQQVPSMPQTSFPMLQQQQQQHNMMQTMKQPEGGTMYLDNLTNHQQQIHKEQLELDLRRKELELLEMRQQELELQRQQLELLSQQQRQQEVTRMPPPLASAQPDGQQPQWWVCQVCSTKAFTSFEEATEHEGLCGAQNHSHVGLQQQQQGFGNAVLPQLPPLIQQQLQQQQFQQQQLEAQYRPTPVVTTSQLNAGPRTFPGMPAGELPMVETKINTQAKFMEQPMQAALMQSAMQTTIQTAMQTPAQQQQVAAVEQGPFVSPKPRPLAMQTDEDWLTPLHCFVRRHCVEIFCATEQDVINAAKGKRNPTQVGQVGIRCPHCHCNKTDTQQSERASVYYPTTISFIYTATMNLLQRHSHACSAVPEQIMTRYRMLKADDARSGTSKKYWVQSALSLGLVDTPNGIRFSARRPPPLPRLQRHHTPKLLMDAYPRSRDDDNRRLHKLNKGKDGVVESGTLVTDDEKPYATAFSFLLLGQMQPCVFTEADRIGKRKGLPSGYPGLACSHCFGGFGSGRFFPSSLKTLSDTSKTLNVLHNHMTKCRKCPQEVKDRLEKFRSNHDIERAKMRFGSQKAFFGKIWDRLHHQDQGFVVCSGSKRKVETTYIPPQKMLSTMHDTSKGMLQLDPTQGQDANKRQRVCL